MGTVSQLTQLGFTPNQAKHLGIDGIEVLLGGWTPLNLVNSTSPFDVVPSVGTYISATSFSVPGDVTSYLLKGDKVSFLNTTRKYGNVASRSFGAGVTTINLIPNSLYSVANTTITDINFASGPASGFPDYFTYTNTTGSDAGTWTPSGSGAQYAIFTVDESFIDGEMVFIGAQTVANANYLTCTIPIATTVTEKWLTAFAQEAGVTPGGFMMLQSGLGTTARIYKVALAQFTGGGNAFISVTFRYPF